MIYVGAGYDQVDIHACSSRGIRVSNTPNAVNDATADAAIFLMLGALRRFNVPMTALRKGNWRGHPPPPLGNDPEGKTLGILGMGGIGRNMKRKAEVFGIQVVYHNRNRLSKDLAAGAEYVTFRDLLAYSDIISINIPLNVSALFGFSPSSHYEKIILATVVTAKLICRRQIPDI
jgi:D-3-phosphoglycerate dehydrogenase